MFTTIINRIMDGKALFKLYLQRNQTPADREYAGILMTGRVVIGATRLYDLLEEAEAAGKRLELVCPLDPEVGPSDPYTVQLSGSVLAN